MLCKYEAEKMYSPKPGNSPRASASENKYCIVHKGVSPPISKSSPITRTTTFLKILHPPTLPTSQSSQVFIINRNAAVKTDSINTTHVKQEP